jgi:protein SCO1/2
MAFCRSILIGLLVGFSTLTWSYEPSQRVQLAEQTPNELQGIGIVEHVGQTIDLNIPFVDDNGKNVLLQKYFNTKPVLLTIVYYDCPSLCNYHLNGLTAALKRIDWTTGQQFDVVAVSMDAREDAVLAHQKKKAYVAEYNRQQPIEGWHFLTGTEANIKKLAQQVGFQFHWVEDQKQFAHASVAYVITPQGKISRYLYGIEFEPQTVRLALVEAADGKISTLVDQLILFCFHFDPAKNKYVLYAFNIMRAGAVLILLVLAAILIPAWRRERRRPRPVH